MQGSPPARLKIVGVVLVLFGSLGIADVLSRARDPSMLDPLPFVAFGLLPFLAGLGLIFEHRWALVLGLIVAGTFVVLGAYTMAQPAEIVYPAAGPISFLALVVPGLLLLATMLSPRSMRWVRHLDEPSSPAPDPRGPLPSPSDAV